MSFKEKFESHPLVFGFTLVIGGFAAGYTVHEALNQQSKVLSEQLNISCNIEGVGKLSDAHHQRISVLQKELVRLEGKASDDSLIPSYQRDYKESATRVRNDISLERAALKESLQVLSSTCK